MHHALLICFLFVLLGLVTGTLSGMLGIGGGLVVVPGLVYVFSYLSFPHDHVMHLAEGTSLSIMICTSTAAVLAHHKKGNVVWPISLRVIPGIIAGTIGGALLAKSLNTEMLQVIFGIFLLLISVKMLAHIGPIPEGKHRLPRRGILPAIGAAIGFKSGLLGIGGGSISIPLLIYCNVPTRKVPGTSSSFSLPIAVSGTLSYIIFGGIKPIIPWSTGFVYWPAFVLAAPLTALSAGWGAKISAVIPPHILRKILLILIFLLALNMLWNGRNVFIR